MRKKGATPSSPVPPEQIGGFVCQCCGRAMELRINGKFCNECATSRAPSPSVREAAEAAAEIAKFVDQAQPLPFAAGLLERDIEAIILKHCSPVSTAGGDEESLQRRCFAECVTANWDPERRNTFAEETAHLHEELSEAFRAWRRYKDCRVVVIDGKPEGVPIEFADVLIGLFYNAELHGFDLLAAVEQKHQYNLTRNYVKEGRQLHAADSAGEEGK